MSQITVLEPVGATFSFDTLKYFHELFKTPNPDDATIHPVDSNYQVIPSVLRHGGYGVLAIYSKCFGKLNPSFDSFSRILQLHNRGAYRPFSVIGGLYYRLNFCMMTRQGVTPEMITGVVAHPAALMACSEKITQMGLKTVVEVASNGAAARLIRDEGEFSEYVTFGPQSAAESFGLSIFQEHAETVEAFTTFVILGPPDHAATFDEFNQAIVVFSTNNTPGALVAVLSLFENENLNITHLHSTHAHENTYDFTLCVDIRHAQIPSFIRVRNMLKHRTKSHLVFGPFPIIPR